MNKLLSWENKWHWNTRCQVHVNSSQHWYCTYTCREYFDSVKRPMKNMSIEKMLHHLTIGITKYIIIERQNVISEVSYAGIN
jgi:hypothetical protein